jgi:CheY-like chemotaxis protein
LDGFAATREIKQFRGARVPAIVAITASAFAEQKQECLEAGCDDFISKPFRREQVLDVLARYLGVEYAESPPDTADWESDRPAPDTAAIDVAKLSVMPPEWRDRLHYAAQLGNDLTMLSLIEQIPPEQDELIRALRAIVENFQFERVIELFEPARADD